MERQNQGGAGAKLLELFGLALAGGLQLNIDQLTACGRGFAQNIQLRGDGAAKLASAGDPPAGGDDHCPGMGLHEALDSGKRQTGLREVVQPELQKGVIPHQGFGLLSHFVRVGADDGHADSWQSQGQKTWRVSRSRIHRSELRKNSGRSAIAGHILNDGELLQGLNYLCNNGLML